MIVAFVQTDNSSVNPTSLYTSIKPRQLFPDLLGASLPFICRAWGRATRQINKQEFWNLCIATNVFQRNLQSRSGQVSYWFIPCSLHILLFWCYSLCLPFSAPPPTHHAPTPLSSLWNSDRVLSVCPICVCLSLCLSESCHPLCPSAPHKVVLLVVGNSPNIQPKSSFLQCCDMWVQEL